MRFKDGLGLKLASVKGRYHISDYRFQTPYTDVSKRGLPQASNKFTARNGLWLLSSNNALSAACQSKRRGYNATRACLMSEANGNSIASCIRSEGRILTLRVLGYGSSPSFEVFRGDSVIK